MTSSADQPKYWAFISYSHADSRIARRLKHSGQHIGDNDVWQAAIALEHDLALVTGNARHFTRVVGLRVRSHRTAPTGV